MRLLCGATLLVVLLPVGARADRKPVSERWTADLPLETNVQGQGLGYTTLSVGEEPTLSLEETAYEGIPAADALPHQLEGATCSVNTVDVERRLHWLECAPERYGWSNRIALLEHDDDLLLLVQLREDSPETRALVESLRPVRAPGACAQGCRLGHYHWLTVRAEGGRRLVAFEDARGLDITERVSEVSRLGDDGIRIALTRHHARRDAPTATVVRKVRVLGGAVGAHEADGGLELSFTRGEGRSNSLWLWGRDSEDLARAVRMVEAATPGPDYDPARPPVWSSPAKALAPERARLGWGVGFGGLLVFSMLALAGWRLRASRAARARPSA